MMHLAYESPHTFPRANTRVIFDANWAYVVQLYTDLHG